MELISEEEWLPTKSIKTVFIRREVALFQENNLSVVGLVAPPFFGPKE